MCCDNQSDSSVNYCCQTSGHHNLQKSHKFSQEIIFPSRSEQIELLKEHKEKLQEQIEEIDVRLKDLE
ncbi:MAG: DUF5320 domain-containing protein [Actinobacteria bacterium]|nr:DUF5320 domain-containing protein [Actinomycetota bacterium]